MKRTLIRLIIFILITSLIACSNDNEVTKDKITYRNQLVFYEGEPYTGIVYDYFEDGKTHRSAISFKNGKLDGQTLEWYESGQLKGEGNAKDGIAEGKSIYWYENGNKMGEENYHNNKKHGKFTIWFEDGNIKSETSYTNDKINGISTTYYLDGAKQSEINYIRGRQIGTVKVWDKEGNITFEDYTPASTENPATSEKEEK